MSSRPPFPPFSKETAMQKVRTFDRPKFPDERVFEFFPSLAGREFDDVGGSLNEKYENEPSNCTVAFGVWLGARHPGAAITQNPITDKSAG